MRRRVGTSGLKPRPRTTARPDPLQHRLVHVQRGHVQALGDPAQHGRLLSEKERDALRARLLRRAFGGEEGA